MINLHDCAGHRHGRFKSSTPYRAPTWACWRWWCHSWCKSQGPKEGSKGTASQWLIHSVASPLDTACGIHPTFCRLQAIWDEEEVPDVIVDEMEDGRVKPEFDIFIKQAVGTHDVFLGLSMKVTTCIQPAFTGRVMCDTALSPSSSTAAGLIISLILSLFRYGFAGHLFLFVRDTCCGGQVAWYKEPI